MVPAADPSDPVPNPARLLIVWWSATGGSRQLARAAADGARRGGGCQVDILEAPSADPASMLAAGGYLFVAPENLGSLAGVMKDFFDRNYYPLLDRIPGRPYATIICAGSDGRGAARQIERIVTGWRLRPVAEPTIVLTDAQTPEAILAAKHIGPADLARAAELGQALAEGLSLGIW